MDPRLLLQSRLNRIASALLLALFVTHVPAQTNTVEIAANTAKALPSCLHYRVRGVCWWLLCGWAGCSVRTSLRVEHFVPELVVSTWHDPANHPWLDVGRPIAVAVSGLGSAMLGTPIDSAGTRFDDDHVGAQERFRDADAIGNPLGALGFLLSGQFPSLTTPSTFPLPGLHELMSFPGSLNGIEAQWSHVPNTVSAATFAQIKSMANVPATIASLPAKIAAVPGALAQLQTGSGNLLSLMNKGMSLPGVSNLPIAGLPSLQSLVNIPSLQVLTGSVFCPPTSRPFALHYQSELDALFWRGVIPADMVYPDSWVSGMSEIGGFPSNTWGSVYPRQGGVTQEHPVKASAVHAQRVASIVSRTAQPHIYSPLVEQGGFRYFSVGPINPNDGGQSAWQRLYPNAQTSCSAFGTNDSMGLVSWGDGNTSASESYSWNLWRRLECCQSMGQVFLGSITW